MHAHAHMTLTIRARSIAREVVALQRCKRYGPAPHALGIGLIGGCNREVYVRGMAQHALGLGLIGGCNREVVALQRCM